MINGFLSVYAQQWDCWIIRQVYFQFFKESPHCSPCSLSTVLHYLFLIFNYESAITHLQETWKIQNKVTYSSTTCQSLICVQLFGISWTVACQAPSSMEFSRQQYWSGLPFPSPGDFPNPRIEPRSPALQADSLPPEPLEKPRSSIYYNYFLSR